MSFYILIEEYILEHIEQEFGSILQYICVSSPNRLSLWHSELIFIQIVLKKIVNKKKYFLKPIAGLNKVYALTAIIRLYTDNSI